MKVKVENSCFYYQGSVHRPGSILEVPETIANHPALVVLEPETIAGSVATDKVDTGSGQEATTDPDPESPGQVPADEAEAKVADATVQEADEFDFAAASVPKSTKKKG